MNCASNKPLGRRAPASGFSLVEMLLAIAITSAFVVGVYAAFISINKGHKEVEARIQALSNGRTALSMMSEEIKSAGFTGSSHYFFAVPSKLAYGDGIDNDGDGKVDEELVNGTLDVAANQSTIVQNDRHAQIGRLTERPLQVGKADLGDAQLDVDAKFGQDTLAFDIYPRVPTAQLARKRVIYSPGTYDNQPNVLLRTTYSYAADNSLVTSSSAPLAFGVAGVDMLYWDPNAQPANQKWVSSWDSRTESTFANPKLPLPAAVYIRLTMIADPRPAEALTPRQPMVVMPLETMVDIESVIHNARFPRPRL